MAWKALKKALERKGWLGMSLCITAAAPACTHFSDGEQMRSSAEDYVYEVTFLQLFPDKELTPAAEEALIAMAKAALLLDGSTIFCHANGKVDLLFPTEIPSTLTPSFQRPDSFVWASAKGENGATIDTLCAKGRNVEQKFGEKKLTESWPQECVFDGNTRAPFILPGLFGVMKKKRGPACASYPDTKFIVYVR